MAETFCFPLLLLHDLLKEFANPFAYAVVIFQLAVVGDGISKSQVKNHLKHMMVVECCVSMVLSVIYS